MIYLLQYLGKTHNLWHKAALMLEQMAFDNGLSSQLVRTKPLVNAAAAEYDFEPSTSGGGSGAQSPQQQTLDCLCELYSLLKEDDMLAGLWQKRAKYSVSNLRLLTLKVLVTTIGALGHF